MAVKSVLTKPLREGRNAVHLLSDTRCGPLNQARRVASGAAEALLKLPVCRRLCRRGVASASDRVDYVPAGGELSILGFPSGRATRGALCGWAGMPRCREVRAQVVPWTCSVASLRHQAG